ncbi:Abelson tyrosine-protein kinase 2 [Collichthys lucidus]|uniref:Abelson tyrosine-protein kinase 2 n=1 Tax=Collichthys lucidus TaxID=240159 RepID=A0A4U5UI40_COLLU|nr:Abelson tyrosine-protein kinase 2 [Collichthys lucidus]
MGQQVGRVGEGTSTGLQPPQPHASQPHQGKGNRGSGAGRRPREPGSSTGTPPGRAAAANVPDPGINIFTQHSDPEGRLCGTYLLSCSSMSEHMYVLHAVHCAQPQGQN